jgi:hypothetical protein
LRDDFVEASVQRLDAIGEQATIGFELRFARASQTDAALSALKVAPTSDQPRREMTQLRELDLKLTFEAARALREDIQDQARSIENTALQERFQVALLTRRQRVIENDEIGLRVAHERTDFFRLTRANVKPWIGCLARSSHEAQNVCSCRPSQILKLV